ncbi:MAG: hypothetical protein AAB519_00950 [Patescibacteria group bacterium]
MSLKKNQKQLLSFLTLFVFSVPLFLFWDPLFASAATPGWVKDLGATITSGMGNAVAYPFKLLLYAIFVVEGWFANVAFTLFNWAINPKYITIFFNLASIYEMWKFVRDFFNLFFILVLLFTAFSIIFQIDKYSNKKIILQLVIAALFVNFSFPISRMIIDATNVPMYFFAQQMSGPDGNGVFGQTLSASRIQNILIPNGDFAQAEFSRLILAIVFMFLFSMTLLVLSLLFLIRLIALLVLVVFSSAGFVASLVPGMQKFSSDWWSNFMKYALFGPAAMFMLLLATRFFAEIDGTDIGLQQVASGASINGLQEMIGSMALFSIPIVMLWMAMGVSNSFSIAGSKTVVKWGENTSKWAGRKVSGSDAAGKRWKSYQAERKKKADAKLTDNMGVRLGRFRNRLGDEVGARNPLSGKGARQARGRLDEVGKQRVDAAAKEYRVNERMSDAELARLHAQARTMNDRSLLAATAKEMSESRRSNIPSNHGVSVTAADMTAIRQQFQDIGGVRNAVAEDVQNKVMGVNPGAVFTSPSGVVDIAAMQRALDDDKIKVDKVGASGLTTEFLLAANRENKLTEQVLSEMRKDPTKNTALNTHLAGAISQMQSALPADLHSVTGAAETATYSAEQVQTRNGQRREQERLHRMYLAQTGDLHADAAANTPEAATLRADIFARSSADTLKQVRNPGFINQYAAEIIENMPTGKIINAVVTLREERGAQRAVEGISSWIDNQGVAAGASLKAQQTRQALVNDHRTRDLV